MRAADESEEMVSDSMQLRAEDIPQIFNRFINNLPLPAWKDLSLHLLARPADHMLDEGR